MGKRKRDHPSLSFLNRHIFLALTAAGGLLLCLFLAVLAVFFSRLPGAAGLQRGQRGTEPGSFVQALKDFDRSFSSVPADLSAAEGALAALDAMEKKAPGIESLLSVLKRRRKLALSDPLFILQYYDAALRAREKYPHSEALAAVQAEALLCLRPNPDEAGETELHMLLPMLSETRFRDLLLGAYVLTGSASGPESAINIPGAISLFTGSSVPEGSLREGLLINAAALSLLKGDGQQGQGFVNTLLQSPIKSQRTFDFAADYFYDSGEFGRAAEILSPLSDTGSLGRLGDALYLAGFRESARTVWKALVSPGDAVVPMGIMEKSFYNLAASSRDPAEEQEWLERLLSLSPAHAYGVIRYSRHLNDADAAAFLGNSVVFRKESLLDLELIRRREILDGPGRTVGETWLLIGRNPGDTRLYEWGAYYFETRREHEEMELLLNMARNNGLGGDRMAFHEALSLIRKGNLDEGEALLRDIERDTAPWQVHANIGRILEARRSGAAALAEYERASAKVTDKTDAALVQLRIARCLKTMGESREARRVLEYAQDLDPENLMVRLELKRSAAEL